MAESRKKLLRCDEKPENPKKFCGKPEKPSVPENAIFKSWKPGKMGKYCGNRKTQFEICGNRKNLFRSCGKPKKTMKSCGNRKVRKLRKAEKDKYFLRKPGNVPPINPPLIGTTH